MYILVAYDVDTVSEKGQKRLRQVAKACKDYGQRVQNSVFECEVSEAQFVTLKSRLSSIMDMELDSIRIYFLSSKSHGRVISLGKVTSYDVNDAIII
jgi:CRISPR-associated protein Cas2